VLKIFAPTGISRWLIVGLVVLLAAERCDADRPRLLVLTDIGNDPADPAKPGWGVQFVRQSDGWYRDVRWLVP
jgi:hypothetical protein